MNFAFLAAGLFLCCQASDSFASPRSFVIDYENNQFLKDGQPFRYVSGSLHYFRVPRNLWRDRLTKLRLGGFNAVQTYIEWSLHEPEPGQFNATNFVDYIKIAQEVGLVVILRPGPYICAERDMGGFPYWLLRENPNMKLRTSDSSYLYFVDKYLNSTLTAVRPLLYSNGGPIITVQVENEYGSYYACDRKYTLWLRDTFKKYLVDDVVLFTTDGNSDGAVKCGRIDEVYATVDFGVGGDPADSFAVQRRAEPKGPLVNSEFYPGWLDHWGDPHQTRPTAAVTDFLRRMLALNASVNMYMFHGGTNFGYTAGANWGPGLQVDPTSYDYDAPLTEAGDPTDKYFAIRDVIGEFLPLPNATLPKPAPKMAFGPVQLYLQGTLLEKLAKNSKHSLSVTSKYPLTFEELSVPYGYIAYTTSIDFNPSDPSQLSIPGLRDRAQVLVDGHYQGTLSRRENILTLPLQSIKGSNLVLLVENQGRIGFRAEINERKGIIGNVTLGSKTLTNWNQFFALHKDIEELSASSNIQVHPYDSTVPATYVGKFRLPPTVTEPLDTFMRLDGWGKGVAFLNGFNLGRYWPRQGPQVTLYVPAGLFKVNQDNVLALFETETAPCDGLSTCTANFVDTHVINGPTPDN